MLLQWRQAKEARRSYYQRTTLGRRYLDQVAREDVMQRHVLCRASIMMASAPIDLVFKLSGPPLSVGTYIKALAALRHAFASYHRLPSAPKLSDRCHVAVLSVCRV